MTDKEATVERRIMIRQIRQAMTDAKRALSYAAAGDDADTMACVHDAVTLAMGQLRRARVTAGWLRDRI